MVNENGITLASVALEKCRVALAPNLKRVAYSTY
jgi:hypothetical protein